MGLERPRDYAEYIQMKIQGPGFEFLKDFSDEEVVEVREKKKKRWRCPCGQACPAEEMTTTFHVPTCPMSVQFPQPKSPKEGKICPLAPDPCPLGPYCLFPVTAQYDPDAPPQRNECYCNYQDFSGCPCVPICPMAPPIPPSPVFKECPFMCKCDKKCCPCEPKGDLKTCMCSQKYKKADYKKYSEKKCPCVSKPEIECPLGVKDCPCLNLTSTSACPLNAIQCPVEQPIAPPPVTPKKDEKETLEVVFTQIESEIDVKKKEEKEKSESKRKKLSFSKYEPKRNRIKFSTESKISINMGNMAKSISFYTMRRRSGDKSSLKPEERRSLQQSEKPLKSGQKCLLEKPKCPMTGAKAEIVNTERTEKGDCPMDLGGCELFPKGRCPMMELGACNCNYPVAPCMAPAQCGYVMAPPQYCYKEDCCMGLPLPPTYPASYGRYDTGVYYRFMSWKPGEKATKHYIEISEEAYPMNFFRGREKRAYDNWWIIRGGKGYEECEKVKEIIQDRGPVGHKGVQFDKKDNPLDLETKIILQNRQHREDQKIRLQNSRLPWSDKF